VREQPDTTEIVSTDATRTAAAARRLHGRLILLACVAGLLSVFAAVRLAPAAPAPAFVTSAAGQGGAGGSKFSHALPRHAELACDSCHRREDNSARPRLPGHKACTDCHIQQFLTSGGPLCANCHTAVEGSDPPLKAFPGLTGFNMRFDHARHAAGAGRPAEGCASCHRPVRRGVALSIPAGAAAHENCYACHTPNARAASGGDISSCATCHAAGRYARTPTNARAYSVSFSHAGHGPRQNLRCDDCHQVRAGAGQGRQVTAPRPTQHFGSGRAQSCMTCHDDRRAFGGDDFADCKRCHKGQTFRF
jgi:c(7)-type cytochrome triheme protein